MIAFLNQVRSAKIEYDGESYRKGYYAISRFYKNGYQTDNFKESVYISTEEEN